ncbi:MAG TPA: site-specific DNA-methyltransferase [Pirellulales bacterium]|jgi:DNA modification methylase|nr:site-specific DNA-methyltransferase [Pirellulales bacterium]
MRKPDWTSPDGGIALHCCPCEELLAGMPPESVDLVVTSPPFNTLAREVNAYGFRAARAGGCDRWLEKVRHHGYHDDRPEADYQIWLRGIVAECLRVCRSLVWINHKPRYRDGRAELPERFLPFDLWDMVIWNRRGSIAQNCRKFPQSFEFLLAFGRPKYWDQECARWLSVWDDIAPARGFDDHPCPWPLAVPRRLIEATCPLGGLVFDPFIGRGTTALACLGLGRRCIGVERDERYFAAAVANVEAELGRFPALDVDERMHTLQEGG